jgi:hypothetical protein
MEGSVMKRAFLKRELPAPCGAIKRRAIRRGVFAKAAGFVVVVALNRSPRSTCGFPDRRRQK